MTYKIDENHRINTFDDGTETELVCKRQNRNLVTRSSSETGKINYCPICGAYIEE